jgi:hypothetical protein
VGFLSLMSGPGHPPPPPLRALSPRPWSVPPLSRPSRSCCPLRCMFLAGPYVHTLIHPQLNGAIALTWGPLPCTTAPWHCGDMYCLPQVISLAHPDPSPRLRLRCILKFKLPKDRSTPSSKSFYLISIFISYKSSEAFVSKVAGLDQSAKRMYLFSLPSPSSTYTISDKKMDSIFSSQGFDDTYSHTPRSRADSGVSTTEGLLQNLHLVETTSFETASYTSSRPTSSRGLPSPAYLSPSLSHSPGYLSTPLSQHQQSFPPLSSEAAISDAEWFQADQPRTPGAPLLRLEPANDQLGAPASSPPLASIETEAMRYDALAGDPSPQLLTLGTVPLPFHTTRHSTWAPDHPLPGQVHRPTLMVSGSRASSVAYQWEQ